MIRCDIVLTRRLGIPWFRLALSPASPTGSPVGAKLGFPPDGASVSGCAVGAYAAVQDAHAYLSRSLATLGRPQVNCASWSGLKEFGEGAREVRAELVEIG